MPAKKVKSVDSLIEQIAELCHEVNRRYCKSLGDSSHKTWAETPEDIKNGTRLGVIFRLSNRDITPEAMHRNWVDGKIKDGWKYGPVKDHTKKEHPNLKPYLQLPLTERVKDIIFMAIVDSLASMKRP